MKIDFTSDLEGYQQARQLHLILEHYAASDHCNDSDKKLIKTLSEEIESFTIKPEFESFQSHDEKTQQPPKRTLMDTLSSFWHGLMGPSRLEIKLSEQRRQLIERAERAEAMSFEALAETAEIGKQRDEALLKIKELQSQLTPPKSS